jgi:hypothetical protein
MRVMTDAEIKQLTPREMSNDGLKSTIVSLHKRLIAAQKRIAELEEIVRNGTEYESTIKATELPKKKA